MTLATSSRAPAEGSRPEEHEGQNEYHSYHQQQPQTSAYFLFVLTTYERKRLRVHAAEATVFDGCAFPTPAAPSAPLQTRPAPARRSRT